MPKEVQLSSVNSILIDDLNNDDNLDIIMAGNLYGSEVETTRNDASYGIYLTGDKTKKMFSPIATTTSGLAVVGEVKDIKLIKGKNGLKTIFFVKNNGNIEAFRLN